MITDVVISAHNEQDTIGGVVQACLECKKINTVLVICDSCDDDTAHIASIHGVNVYKVNYMDKGSVMAYGLTGVETDYVMFLDADTKGLTGEHLDQLFYPPTPCQTIGIKDNLYWLNRGLRIPSISGDRRLPTEVARAAGLDGMGWKAETLLNVAVKKAGLKTYYANFKNASNPSKLIHDPIGWGSEMVTVGWAIAGNAKEL